MLKNISFNMKQKQILIILIVIILAVVACLTTYMLVHSHQESFMTLRISSSCTVDVPNTNNTVERLDGGVTRYMFPSSELNITHQKSGNNSEIRSINSNQIKNSEKIEEHIYRDTSTGIYSMFIENKGTGDALLITSSNLDLLKKVFAGIKFKKVLNKNIDNNTTDNATEEDINEPINESNWESWSWQPASNQSGSKQNTNPQPDTTPSSDPVPEKESKYPSYIPWS